MEADALDGGGCFIWAAKVLFFLHTAIQSSDFHKWNVGIRHSHSHIDHFRDSNTAACLPSDAPIRQSTKRRQACQETPCTPCKIPLCNPMVQVFLRGWRVSHGHRKSPGEGRFPAHRAVLPHSVLARCGVKRLWKVSRQCIVP